MPNESFWTTVIAVVIGVVIAMYAMEFTRQRFPLMKTQLQPADESQ